MLKNRGVARTQQSSYLGIPSARRSYDAGLAHAEKLSRNHWVRFWTCRLRFHLYISETNLSYLLFFDCSVPAIEQFQFMRNFKYSYTYKTYATTIVALRLDYITSVIWNENATLISKWFYYILYWQLHLLLWLNGRALSLVMEVVASSILASSSKVKSLWKSLITDSRSFHLNKFLL